MSESLVKKLNRMQGEIDSLKSKPIAKPVNYKEGIRILEEANKNLNEILSGINKRYELIEKELAKANKEIKIIKDKASNNKDINLTEEIKKIINLNYVNRLYGK